MLRIQMKFCLVILSAMSCLSMALASPAQSTSRFNVFSSPLVGIQPSKYKLKNSNHLRPFSTDGCSLAPNGIPKLLLDSWVECCIEHDVKYWPGGTLDDKNRADLELKECISNTGSPRVAELYYITVSTLTGAMVPATYRWGYGWEKKRDFRPLTSWETKQVVDQWHSVNENRDPKFILNVLDLAPRTFLNFELSILEWLQLHIVDNSTIERIDKSKNDRDGYDVQVIISGCTQPIDFRFLNRDILMQVNSSNSCASIR